ncbi:MULTISPECIES: hypothetical protein [Hyphobacterium]|uniref:Uncharacterized protein n=1 Tax=Hyphobacterium vulgare TaxID=1736751 RepID=A0ABV6ZXV6_9PROT
MKQTVNRQEIQQLLTDPGYSADDRDERLKQALTVLSSEEADAGNPDGERSKLIADIRREIDRQAIDPGERSGDR